MAISKTEYLKGLDKAKKYTDSKVAEIDQVELDSTLSQSGQAADSKATGDAIKGLESIVTELDDVEINVSGSGINTEVTIDGNVVTTGSVNDDGVSSLGTWSSSKINSEFIGVREDIILLENLLLEIKEKIESINNAPLCSEINQMIVDYFENKTAKEIE